MSSFTKGRPKRVGMFQSSAHVTYTSNSLAKTNGQAKPKLKDRRVHFTAVRLWPGCGYQILVQSTAEPAQSHNTTTVR